MWPRSIGRQWAGSQWSEQWSETSYRAMERPMESNLASPRTGVVYNGRGCPACRIVHGFAAGKEMHLRSLTPGNPLHILDLNKPRIDGFLDHLPTMLDTQLHPCPH